MPKVEDSQENVDACLKFCKPCLTYPGGEGEALFCSRGKSDTPKPKKGCNCGICDVRKKYGCTGFYYCVTEPCE
jgi:hypothetical protein